jgi:hypothetical protein
MSEPQETRIGQKQERIEKPQVSSSKPRKVYVLGVAFVAVLLLGTSFGIMISGTTPGFPTVIEPGSNVIGASYIVFKDGSNYYARNGSTGAIDSSSATALTIIEYAMDNSPRSGIIAIGPQSYLWSGSSYLLIDKPGITFIGASSLFEDSVGGVNDPTPTILGGNITIISEGVRMESLNIGGTLTITSNDANTIVGRALRFLNVNIMDGLSIIGRSGASDWYVPGDVIFSTGEIGRRTPGPVIDFDDLGAGMSFFYFYQMQIQIASPQPGDVISMSGGFDSIYWTECFFGMNLAGQTMLNITKAPIADNHYWQIGFTNCKWESPYNDVQYIAVADGLAINSTRIGITFRGGYIQTPYGGTLYILNDYTGMRAWHNPTEWILFDGIHFSYLTNLKFRSLGGAVGPANEPAVLPVFVNCMFGTVDMEIRVTQIGSLDSVGRFLNNPGFNPTGLIAKPFWADATIPTGPWFGALTLSQPSSGATGPTSLVNYTARDLDYLITSTGGAGVSIFIYDPNNVLISTSSTLTRQLLPFGYRISWTYSGAPTVIVEGL